MKPRSVSRLPALLLSLSLAVHLLACGEDKGDEPTDADKDGVFTPEDCDDSRADAFPGGTEIWYDGIDQDCSGTSDFDQDGDGADSSTYGGTDCFDEDPELGPQATETWYDGLDADCAGGSDYDADGDGRDSDEYWGDDCDDTDAATYPGAPDSKYDGVDADCLGDSDYDADGDGYDSADYGGDDCDDHNAYQHPNGGETWYDGMDQDCDGWDDWDADMDGYASEDAGGPDCDDTDPTFHPGAPETWYDGVDQDCGGGDDYDADGDGAISSAWGGDDCDDTNPLVWPGAPESWYDGLDSDCDGANDSDADLDGDMATPWGTDCDDTDPTIHGYAAEVCDGLDNDCNGTVDDGVTGTFFADVDGDGYGDAASVLTGCGSATGYVTDATDCDDADPSVNPGVLDDCDGWDENCDSVVDDDGGCPCSQEWSGATSYLFCTAATDWVSAEAACLSLGYSLVTIEDRSEDTSLPPMAQRYSGSDYWIGYNDRSLEGLWSWSDGSASAYTHWASGQPDDAGGNQDCAQMNTASSPVGSWADMDCATALPYICQASP